MFINNLKIFVVLMLSIALAGCEKPDATEENATATIAPVTEAAPDPVSEPAPVEEADKAEIAWFDGSVEEAFALARAENTPLFLYWGAVWCPPCVEIKNTVFKSPQFIAQTELFVPVYLDGDTEHAQEWGDRFGTKVYPTMIVFNPEGEEVTRLNAGVDISAYNSVLELSLESMQPMDELVAAALTAPDKVSDTDYQRLAYYSWYDGKALPEGTPAQAFLALSEEAAKTNLEAGARLYLQYLTMLAEEEIRDPQAVAKLGAILTSPALVFASWDYLLAPEPILPALGGSDENIAALKEGWATVMMDARHDERLSTKNQLYGWRPYLVFHFEGDEEKSTPLPEDIAEAIRSDGRAADESVAGTHSRQSVINTASNVYLLAGMTEDARALLVAEIEKSKTPYYFMGSLGYLEEQEGNDDAALEWRRKAYEASEGPATRIRWWASYVQALARIAPENGEAILQAAMYPFDPEQGMSELFAGANKRNLQRAKNALEEWDMEETELDEFHAALAAACREAGEDCLDL